MCFVLWPKFAVLTWPSPCFSVLLVLSFASFLPQLQLLWLRRDSSGISLYYVLFNLIIATELFTIDLAMLTSVDGGDIFVHSPASTGDWLNLAQFGTVCIMWTLMYVNPSSGLLPLSMANLKFPSVLLPASCSTLETDLIQSQRPRLYSTHATSSSLWCP